MPQVMLQGNQIAKRGPRRNGHEIVVAASKNRKLQHMYIAHEGACEMLSKKIKLKMQTDLQTKPLCGGRAQKEQNGSRAQNEALFSRHLMRGQEAAAEKR